MTRAPTITETAEQRTIVAYLNKAGFVGDVRWTAIRAERMRASDGIASKKAGVKKSFPDLLFVGNGRRVWVEMKRRGFLKRTNKTGHYNEHELEQLAMHDFLRRNGDIVAICESLEDVIRILGCYGLHVRPESITTERIKRGMRNAMAEIENG